MVGSHRTERDTQRDARAWADRLRQTHITSADLRAFRDWLDDEASDLAWQKLMAEDHVHERFAVRRDAAGFSVVDTAAAPVAEIDGQRLEGLSGYEAERAARTLNRPRGRQ